MPGSSVKSPTRAGELLLATHPIPAASVTVLTGALVAGLGAPPSWVGLAVASVVLGQASVGWSNDYFDRFRDAAAGRNDKPLVRGGLEPRHVVAAAVASLIASPLVALMLGPREALVIAVALASAWLYNLRLKQTWWSWAPYAISFGLLPVFAWLAARDVLPPAWIVVPASLLAIAAHLTNVIPDLADDEAAGIKGLPHRLGLRGCLLVASTVLTAQLVIVVIRTEAWRAPASAPGAASVAAAALVVAVGWAGARGRGRLGFHLTIGAVAAMALVLLLSRAL